MNNKSSVFNEQKDDEICLPISLGEKKAARDQQFQKKIDQMRLNFDSLHTKLTRDQGTFTQMQTGPQSSMLDNEENKISTRSMPNNSNDASKDTPFTFYDKSVGAESLETVADFRKSRAVSNLGQTETSLKTKISPFASAITVEAKIPDKLETHPIGDQEAAKIEEI